MTRRQIATVLLGAGCIALIALGIMVRYTPYTPTLRILPELDPLPALEEPPSDNQTLVVVDNVTLGALVSFNMFQPHNGANRFWFYLEINVTNNGNMDIDDFNAAKASVFKPDGSLVYTFGLLPSSNATIEVGERRILDYDEDRDMPQVLSNLGSDGLYLRVLVTFNSNTSIIVSTPLTLVLVAME